MKNIVIVVLTALLLFSIAASLSFWLNQSSATTAAAVKQKIDNPTKRETKPGELTDTKPASEPQKKSELSTASPKTPPADLAAAMASLREREAQLERRLSQLDVILRDLQSEREQFDAFARQLTLTLRAATKKLDEQPRPATAVAPMPNEETERKNIERLAAMFDNMPADGAAPILKQLADSGQLNMAARILLQMKERNSSRLLAELGDPALAAQLLERIRTIKMAAPAAANVQPAAAPVPQLGK